MLEAYPDALVIHNKCDLAETADDRPAGLCVSALTGEGAQELVSTFAERLVPDPPPTGAGVPFTPLQVDAVAEALTWAIKGKLKEAAKCLRELVGRTSYV